MNRMFYTMCAVIGAVLAGGLAYVTGDKAATGASRGAAIMLADIQGASGDGNTALRTAFSVMLENIDIPQTDSLEGCSLAVSAEVSTQRIGTTDQVSIIWQVHDATGSPLGEVAQLNTVPAGKLDQAWGTDASLAARGARDGLIAIMRRPRSGCV